jgi:hypothetical protein
MSLSRIAPYSRGSAASFRFSGSAALSAPGAVATVASLFFSWLGITLSACVFSMCGSTNKATFSIVEISGTNVLLNLLGGPFYGLVPVVSSYGHLALWCLGAAGFGLYFAAYHSTKREKPGKLFTRPRRSLFAVLLSLLQLFLVGGTTLQMYHTFQLQSAASISIINVSPGSYIQTGPLLLLLGLALLTAAALLSLRAPKARAGALGDTQAKLAALSGLLNDHTGS